MRASLPRCSTVLQAPPVVFLNRNVTGTKHFNLRGILPSWSLAYSCPEAHFQIILVFSFFRCFSRKKWVVKTVQSSLILFLLPLYSFDNSINNHATIPFSIPKKFTLAQTLLSKICPETYRRGVILQALLALICYRVNNFPSDPVPIL